MPNALRANGGRFAPGNPGGPGRPKREAERKYLATMASVVSIDQWKAICEAAVVAAIAGDSKARQWLSSYLMPTPGEVSIGDAEAVPQPEVDERSAAMARLAERLRGDVSIHDPGDDGA